MTALLAGLHFWHWWILAAVLMALEAMMPGAIFIWLGISAALVGLLLLLDLPLAWEVQLVVFAMLSLLTVLGWRGFQRRRAATDAEPTLNRRGEQYIGRRFTLTEPIANGKGRLRIDDTLWRIAGEDMAAGTSIRVTGVDGVILQVERG